MSGSKDLMRRIHDVLKQFPEGLTSPEIKELFPDEGGPNTIHMTLHLMKQGGQVKVSGERKNPNTGSLCSVFHAGEMNNPVSWGKPRKVSKPTDAGLAARLATAQAAIAELERWKADAIARFPDLGVDPAVVRARQHLAAMFRSDGDTIKAEQVLSGNMDRTPIMRSAVSLIEQLAG